MSHLLGAQGCVESLRRDVIDLQGALVEVFSRTGPVRFRSWRFPERESCDLDLVTLLEQYRYTEGKEELNQHAHIVLLELVIDRLLLLLQSFNTYTEQMLGGQRAGDCGRPGGSVCVGLVVKRYWNNLIQFNSQQRQQRMSSVSRPDSSSSSTPPPPRTALSPSLSSSHSLHTSYAPREGCQTLESALVPCDACARVQATLQDSARAVASLCRALGLSCQLWSPLQAAEETLQLGRLSACDLALWAREQHRDLGRIQTHVTQVQEKLESLTHTLQKVEEERDEIKAQLEREKETSTREREERRRREEECERRLQEETHRRDEELKHQQGALENLRRVAAALEVKISELEGEVELRRETQQCVERERDSLLEEVHRLHLEEMSWRQTEEEKRNLETDLSDAQTRLDKESAKYQSVQRRHEATVVKQQALLERVDALLQQCEDLQSRLDECEDQKAELTDTLTHTTQERNTLQEQLTQQESEFLSLNEDKQKQCVRLQEMEECVSRLTEELRQSRERERLLVAFPELNPHHAVPQTTGDVLCDMEQQLKVNSIRIRVLEQENTSLTKTLSRLRDAQTVTLGPQGAGDAHTLCSDSASSEVDRRERGKEKQITSSASQSSSSSSVLHHQTISLSLIPDAKERYGKLRQAARERSAGTNRRRK
ncbi:LOW QUALITY PROTEIN: coiled-coil domain-containing protein 157-like [Clarias gariepinus]